MKKEPVYLVGGRGKTRKHRYRGNKFKGADRRKKKRSCTKAELKRRMRANLSEVVQHLTILNRIDILPEKRFHLEKAIELLDAVLEHAGGRSKIRLQRVLCAERLNEIERGAADSRSLRVDIVLEGPYSDRGSE